MEGMRQEWGWQPGHGQAGSRAPSQPKQDALGEHISLSLGTAPHFLPAVRWEETLGASPGLPEDLSGVKVAERVLPCSTLPLWLVLPALSSPSNSEMRPKKDVEIIRFNLFTVKVQVSPGGSPRPHGMQVEG